MLKELLLSAFALMATSCGAYNPIVLSNALLPIHENGCSGSAAKVVERPKMEDPTPVGEIVSITATHCQAEAMHGDYNLYTDQYTGVRFTADRGYRLDCTDLPVVTPDGWVAVELNDYDNSLGYPYCSWVEWFFIVDSVDHDMPTDFYVSLSAEPIPGYEWDIDYTLNHCSLLSPVYTYVDGSAYVTLVFEADEGYAFSTSSYKACTGATIYQTDYETDSYVGFGQYTRMKVTLDLRVSHGDIQLRIDGAAKTAGVIGNYTFGDDFRPTSWYVQGGGSYSSMYFDGWMVAGVPSDLGEYTTIGQYLSGFDFVTPDGLVWNRIYFDTDGTGTNNGSSGIRYGTSSMNRSDYTVAPDLGIYFNHMAFAYYEGETEVRRIIVAETLWDESTSGGLTYVTIDWHWVASSYRNITFYAPSISTKVHPLSPYYGTLDISGMFLSYSPVTENWVGSSYDPFALLKGGFGVWARLFSVTLIPGITLGVMFTLPLVIALIVLVLKVIHR